MEIQKGGKERQEREGRSKELLLRGTLEWMLEVRKERRKNRKQLGRSFYLCPQDWWVILQDGVDPCHPSPYFWEWQRMKKCLFPHFPCFPGWSVVKNRPPIPPGTTLRVIQNEVPNSFLVLWIPKSDDGWTPGFPSHSRGFWEWPSVKRWLPIPTLLISGVTRSEHGRIQHSEYFKIFPLPRNNPQDCRLPLVDWPFIDRARDYNREMLPWGVFISKSSKFGRKLPISYLCRRFPFVT